MILADTLQDNFKISPYQYNTYFSPVTIEMIGVLLDLEGFRKVIR